MLLTELAGNDIVERRDRSVIIRFGGKRNVLSTGPLNGGYREDLKYVFNHDGKDPKDQECKMKGKTYREHMEVITRELHLPIESSCGVATAASMENTSIKSETFRDVTVTAIVTAGINVNGGRVGDPAYWYEENGHFVNILTQQKEEEKHGTINIMLHFNINLDPGALTRAMVTCTEAKTAAIQELLLPSRYSRGLATGSGTDSTILVANAESAICFHSAGKHAKLGELIGKSVKNAVKEALSLQSNQNPKLQHNVIKRVERFGIFIETLWEQANRDEPDCMTRKEFGEKFNKVVYNERNIVYTSLYAHLIDQLDWGLLSVREVRPVAKAILKHMAISSISLTKDIKGKDDFIETMIDALKSGLVVKILKVK